VKDRTPYAHRLRWRTSHSDEVRIRKVAPRHGKAVQVAHEADDPTVVISSAVHYANGSSAPCLSIYTPTPASPPFDRSSSPTMFPSGSLIVTSHPTGTSYGSSLNL
jgi:hypothetical protein